MRSLKKFEEFLDSGIIRKQSQDRERAEGLELESKNKPKFFEKEYAEKVEKFMYKSLKILK